MAVDEEPAGAQGEDNRWVIRVQDELSHKATVAGLDMAQAANAAAQTTLDYNQQQMKEMNGG